MAQFVKKKKTLDLNLYFSVLNILYESSISASQWISFSYRRCNSNACGTFPWI